MRRLLHALHYLLMNLGLKPKFWLIIVSLSLVSCTVILAYAYLVFRNYDAVLYQNTSQLLNMSVNNIENDLMRAEKSSDEIATHPLIQSALRKQTMNAAMDAEPNARKKEATLVYNVAASNIFNVLSAELNDNPDILTVSLYFEDQRMYAGSSREDIRTERLSAAFAAAGEASGRPVWLSSGFDDYSVVCIREIKGMHPLTLETLATLVVRVDLRRIVDRHLQQSANLAYPPQLSLMSEDGQIYSDIPMDIAGDFEGEAGYRVLSLEGGKYFATYASQSRFDWRYMTIVPFDKVIGSLTRLRWIALLIGILTIVLSMMLAARWVSRMTRHFDALVQKMQTFKNGQFALAADRDYMNRKDEMGFLHQSFHRMAEDIRRLVEDNYVKQLLIKDARIRALQQQLHPHFLFNVLQSVNWEAKANRQTTISTMLESLGKLLRYTVGEEAELVPLERELEATRSYVALQIYRYRERLSVGIDIPEDLYGMMVPKLALQNIVENAIKHTLEMRLEPCAIRLYARQDERSFSLFVEDNGPGIDESVLDKPARKEAASSGLGIGLNNIQQRIQLLFSPECGLRFRNTGHGTIVEMVLTKQDGGTPRA
ncbi:sensor histidine kinase [Cohnella hongkongensis]|uniref:histidine kinase n=1 Tax=Cohnella hongkongensis TaxID=178337 RepID=A0ABV9FCZ7_9BACL